MNFLRGTALLRSRLTRTAALLCALLPGLALGASPAAAATGSPSLDGRERTVIERINAVRADHGLAPLTTRRKLSHAADRHTARQLSRRTLSHQLPGEASLQGRLRLSAGRLPVGEVVAWAARQGSGSAAIVRNWMDSPEHRALLLSGDFRVAGIGIRTGSGGLYATVDLAAH
jgi:uncharacterized protein YkwD